MRRCDGCLVLHSFPGETFRSASLFPSPYDRNQQNSTGGTANASCTALHTFAGLGVEDEYHYHGCKGCGFESRLGFCPITYRSPTVYHHHYIVTQLLPLVKEYPTLATIVICIFLLGLADLLQILFKWWMRR